MRLWVPFKETDQNTELKFKVKNVKCYPVEFFFFFYIDIT